MRKHNISLLVVTTIVFAAFLLGFFLGKNQNQDRIVVSLPNKFMTAPPPETEALTEPTEEKVISFPISINHAVKEEIMALPGIGDVLAGRILAYREEHGNFSSAEELLNVEGLGEKRLEDIWDLITVGD